MAANLSLKRTRAVHAPRTHTQTVLAVSLSLTVGVLGPSCFHSAAVEESPETLQIELGTGEAVFEPLDNEQVVPLIAGVQGGYHVWISVRAHGLSSERALFGITTTVADWADQPLPREINAFFELREGVYELVGFPARMRRERCTPGREVHIEVSVRDSRTGQSASAARRVRIDPASKVLGADFLTGAPNDCPP